MITAPLAFLTQSNAVNNDDAALRGWVKEIIGNRDIPLPTAAQDWALLRRWHILIQSLTLLSQWENAKLAQSSQSWTPLALDQHQAILQPLLESPALSSLAHVFSTLSLEITPPTSIPALLSLDLVPSFLSTYQTLENQLLDSTLQIDQLSNLRTDIEIGLTTQIELQRTAPVFPEENQVAIERATESSLLLSRKTEEYKSRLAALEKRANKYEATIPLAERCTIPQIEGLANEYSALKLRRNELRDRLLVYGDLPSDIAQARTILLEKRKAVAVLRLERDKMLNDMGAAVF